ncbi:MAG: 6-hydroxymethylpterin diphosphokinase MptE-like protein [Thermoprotei archaeon]
MVALENWLPWYEKIRLSMGYNKLSDIRACKILSILLRKKEQANLNHLSKLITGKTVFVYGAAPELDEAVERTLKIVNKVIVMAADGSVTRLLESNIVPNFVFTDLDGRMESILEASSKGSIVVVHGHGDNIDKLRYTVPKLKGQVIGTCQVEPCNGVYNFGGFTDGDRAVFFAEHFKAKNIVLLGWSFKGFVGKYSKPWLTSITKASDTKMKKLKFARELISWLSKISNTRIFSVGEEIPNTINIKYDSLHHVLVSHKEKPIR